ncbi:hypothetical protein ACKI1Q_42525 [Streptomyces galilaeus]|uniref:hypothetical protein n=1 Tax=Streptomyces bobili TaxID=67280 RepID=UPI003822C8C3
MPAAPPPWHHQQRQVGIGDARVAHDQSLAVAVLLLMVIGPEIIETDGTTSLE